MAFRQESAFWERCFLFPRFKLTSQKKSFTTKEYHPKLFTPWQGIWNVRKPNANILQGEEILRGSNRQDTRAKGVA